LGTLDEIAARCARSFGSGGPISLTLDALEYWRKPRVLCATASGAPAAADEFAYGSPSALADALKRALTDAAFAPDLKPFRPHVTLARKVTQCVPPRTIESVTWKFGGFALVESDAGAEGSGSSYSTVKKWILDKRD
jgi:2'-5' RNA ligase